MSDQAQRLGLHATSIESAGDVEHLRIVRNTCREGYAHDNAFISENVQRAWWVAMRGRVKGWLYWLDVEVFASVLVGYGLLRQTEDGRWWASIGVLPQHAGRGYGKAIMADTIRRHDGEVWSEARLDNPAAIRIHPEPDWQLVSQDERLARFRAI